MTWQQAVEHFCWRWAYGCIAVGTFLVGTYIF
jgi:hypothetical protein